MEGKQAEIDTVQMAKLTAHVFRLPQVSEEVGQKLVNSGEFLSPQLPRHFNGGDSGYQAPLASPQTYDKSPHFDSFPTQGSQFHSSLGSEPCKVMMSQSFSRRWKKISTLLHIRLSGDGKY